jgi:gluconate 2-dehydrogenase gamma chain
MDDPYAVDRRGFLKAGGVAAAGAAVGCGRPSGRWRALTDEEARTLAAACDQIIPPDQDPGADQAGVVSFVDRQLATRQKKTLSLWQAGLRGLEATARRRHGTAFTELPGDAQIAMLADLEKAAVEPAEWIGIEPRAFFALLREHTMMGFYGDPRHGGNKDRVSWKMLGVPDPPIRGRLHETPAPPALGPRAPRSPGTAPPLARKP